MRRATRTSARRLGGIKGDVWSESALPGSVVSMVKTGRARVGGRWAVRS